jgi:predicted O-methyltransferase YrrM
MNKIEHLAHGLHQKSAESDRLRGVLESRSGRQLRAVGRWTVRQYYEYHGSKGRFDWQGSANLLAAEAVRRGAMQKQAELTGLLDVLKEHKPRHVLEIGTARGGMFFALAHIAVPKANLVSVDLPAGEFGGGYGNRGRKRLESYALPSQQLNLFQADSHNPAVRTAVVESLDGQPLDFLMIDGDHTREGVEQDWQMYRPLVRPGGLIAFHDITSNATDPRCQVPEFWQELRGSHDSAEIIETPTTIGSDWGGIGVITTAYA